MEALAQGFDFAVVLTVAIAASWVIYQTGYVVVKDIIPGLRGQLGSILQAFIQRQAAVLLLVGLPLSSALAVTINAGLPYWRALPAPGDGLLIWLLIAWCLIAAALLPLYLIGDVWLMVWTKRVYYPRVKRELMEPTWHEFHAWAALEHNPGDYLQVTNSSGLWHPVALEKLNDELKREGLAITGTDTWRGGDYAKMAKVIAANVGDHTPQREQAAPALPAPEPHGTAGWRYRVEPEGGH